MVIKYCPLPKKKISKLEDIAIEVWWNKEKKIFLKDRTSLSYGTNCSSLIHVYLGDLKRETWSEKYMKKDWSKIFQIKWKL